MEDFFLEYYYFSFTCMIVIPEISSVVQGRNLYLIARLLDILAFLHCSFPSNSIFFILKTPFSQLFRYSTADSGFKESFL